jgi:hypothetical protein
MTRQLEVWLLGVHTGTLSQIEGRLRFAYAPGRTLFFQDRHRGPPVGGTPATPPGMRVRTGRFEGLRS